MDEPSRMMIASDLLDEAYELTQDYEGIEKINIIYKFLIGAKSDVSGLNESICSSHVISQELLNVYKRDAMVVLFANGYEYLRYLDKENEIYDEERQLLNDLDKLSFTFTHLFDYFTSPKNYDKVIRLLVRHYEYISKSNKIINECQDYSFDNQTPFRNAIVDYLSNVEALDFVCMLFDELDEKYQGQINFVVSGEEEVDDDEKIMLEEEWDEEEFVEEDFDEEAYQESIDELFNDHSEAVHQILLNFQVEFHDKLMDWLENYFGDKFESDNFFGFLASYLYKFLLDTKKNGRLLEEEKQLLDLYERPDTQADILIQSFYDNPKYAFEAIESLSRHYYDYHTDILTMRDREEDDFVASKIRMLDEYYPTNKLTSKVILRSTEIYEICDMIFMKYKIDYPNDYLERLYTMLIQNSDFEPIFYELDMGEDALYCRIILIRYFCRIFISSISIADLSSITSDEYPAFEQIMGQEATNYNLAKIFSKYGLEILKRYELTLNLETKNERENIRKNKKSGVLKRMFLIDPMIVGDSTFYRALTDSKIYQYIEQNGIAKANSYLHTLAKEDYIEARDMLNEILVSIYMNAESKQELNAIERMVMSSFDMKKDDFAFFIKAALDDLVVLLQLLEQYYENEKDEDYPLKFEERLVQLPKVKEKLYPL